MNANERRVMKLEAAWPPAPCPTCAGWSRIEVVMLHEGDEPPAPLPQVCPDCGRTMGTAVRRIVCHVPPAA